MSCLAYENKWFSFAHVGIFCTSLENINIRLFSRDGPVFSKMVYFLDMFRNFYLVLGINSKHYIVHYVNLRCVNQSILKWVCDHRFLTEVVYHMFQNKVSNEEKQ